MFYNLGTRSEIPKTVFSHSEGSFLNTCRRLLEKNINKHGDGTTMCFLLSLSAILDNFHGVQRRIISVDIFIFCCVVAI